MAPPLFDLANTALRHGTTLIEASAGTGKTFTIAGLVLRLIIEQSLAIQEILVTTYTVPATAELRDRIRRRMRDALSAFQANATSEPFLQQLLQANQACRAEIIVRLERALRNFDEAPIFSIHGFCHRILGDKAFESGVLFDAELVPDQSAVLAEVVEDFWRKQFYEGSPLLAAIALKRKLKPKLFFALLAKLTNHPGIITLPEQTEPLDQILKRLVDAFQELRDCWLADGVALRQAFSAGYNDWAKHTYGDPVKMELRLAALHKCLGESETAPELLECLHEFTGAKLSSYLRKGKSPPNSRLFELCDRFLEAEEKLALHLQVEFVQWAGEELRRRKLSKNLISFDDMQTRLRDALRSPGGPGLARGIRSRFKAALVDEFQDTDPIQYEIFSRIYDGAEAFLFFIGDPKQAIYGFRGADIFTYLDAADKATDRFTLGTNYRSESGLVHAVNTIFSQTTEPFLFDRIAFAPVAASGESDKAPLQIDGSQEPPFQLWLCNEPDPVGKEEATSRIVESVSAEISKLLGGNVTVAGKPLAPPDIAVLVATHKQGALMQAALQKLSIPSVLHSQDSVFESREAVELMRILDAVVEPAREPVLRAALATDVLGVSGDQINSFCSDEKSWEDVLLRWQDYHHLWKTHGFIQMFRRLLLKEQVRLRLLAFEDGERRLTNLLHLSELLHQAITEERLGMNGSLKWLAEQISGGGAVSELDELRLERDENAVRIVTMHKSKGLEYPVVFCPFAWEGADLRQNEVPTFHDPGNGNVLTQDLAADKDSEHHRIARTERLAEKLRLFYVALTRAKHRCYFICGRFSRSEDSAPNYLFHNPGAEPVVDALKMHVASLDPDRFAAPVERLAETAPGAIHITPLPNVSGIPYRPDTSEVPALTERRFHGHIKRDWRISSFSWLERGRDSDTPDYDALHEATAARDIANATGIFAFPRGRKAGTCLHKIFEQLDFQADDSADLVRMTLEAFGLDVEQFGGSLCQMVKDVLHVPLLPGREDFKLAHLPRRDCLHELEFHFPISRIAQQPLKTHFAKFGLPDSGVDIPDSIGRLTFNPVRGYLKGFIDLVFQFEGKYYLVDWKSNWLGARPEAYDGKAIAGEMLRHYYFLQYPLYCVALHRYLQMRLPGYDYDQHFGGVFYIFIRGVTASNSEQGMFRDRPTKEMIVGLSDLLGGGAQ